MKLSVLQADAAGARRATVLLAGLLLGYAAPAVHGELKTTLANAAERLKRDGASTVFSARDLSVDARAMRVGVRGQLTTFISDRRVSDVPKGYVIELQWTNGRITLKSFRETVPHDPLTVSYTHLTLPTKA